MGENFFDQRVKNNLTTNDNIRIITIGHGYDYSNGCILDYNYFNNYYKIVTIDLNNKYKMLIQKQYN